MNKVIDNYRGFDIYFNTETEEFYLHSDYYDTQEYKKTYKSAVAYIDLYYKNNENFSPIYVQTQGSVRASPTFKTIIGIRKDDRFVYEYEGKKEQLSDYDLKSYFEVNPVNDKVYEKLSKISSDIEKLHVQYKETERQLVIKPLEDIKKEILKDLRL